MPQPTPGKPTLPRPLAWALIGALLGVCAGFPLLQAGWEIFRRGEPPGIFRLFSSAPTHAHLKRWDQEMRDRSFLHREVRPRMLQASHRIFGELPTGVVAGKSGWLFYADGVRAQLAPGPGSAFRKPRILRDTSAHGRSWELGNPISALALFRAALAERDIELVLAPIPGKAWVYPERLTAGAKHPESSPARVSLAEWKRAGWPVVDLYSAFAAAKVEGDEDLFLPTDTHWSPAGVRVAAAAFAEILSADTGLSAHAQTGRYRLESLSAVRRGDLAEMTGLPDRESLWESESIRSERVVEAETGKAYRDDPHSPVLWLGDSFSRIYQTDVPGSSGIIAQVAFRLGMALTSLVLDGGAAVDVRRRLQARPEYLEGKRVVVWAFAEREWVLSPETWVPVALPPPSSTP